MRAPTPEDIELANAMHEVGLSIFIAMGASGVAMFAMIARDIWLNIRERKSHDTHIPRR